MVIWFNLIAVIVGLDGAPHAHWISVHETLEECQVAQRKFEEAHPEAKVWCPFVIVERL